MFGRRANNDDRDHAIASLQQQRVRVLSNENTDLQKALQAERRKADGYYRRLRVLEYRADYPTKAAFLKGLHKAERALADLLRREEERGSNLRITLQPGESAELMREPLSATYQRYLEDLLTYGHSRGFLDERRAKRKG